MNSPVYVKHDYIDGCLYMLRDKFSVIREDGLGADEFEAGEVYIFNGKTFVSTVDKVEVAPGIIRKLKNEMIPDTLWEERGLKWEKK